MARVRISPATDAALTRAAEILRGGGLVAFPTETVYGLGADATNAEAVARIFAAKERPRINPLIAHVSDLGMASLFGAFDLRAAELAERFWPGALTLVVPRTPDCAVSLLACAGLDTIALRAPSHPVAQHLIAALGRPIAAPSANRSGEPSPTLAEHVADSLGAAVDLILDGGATALGLESTVIGFAGDDAILLRHGAIARDEIEEITGPLSAPETMGRPSSPGQMFRHYAPRHAMRLDAYDVRSDEALIAFGANVPHGARIVFNLSPTGDLKEAAANLFAHLRAADASGARAIAVMPVPDEGLGEAINDRLRRAAGL